MGKKRIIQKGETAEGIKIDLGKLPKKKISSGRLYIQSTYNNTIITLTDKEGNTVMQSSCGAIGYKGAKKGTPFAASKVAELIAEKGKKIGLKDVDIFVKGVGPGRDSALRTIASKGLEINLIRDITPIPHNGPKPPKPRRV